MTDGAAKEERWVRDDITGTMNQVEYAAHANCTKQYVNTLVKTGAIPVDRNGKIDPAVADHARGKNSPPTEPPPEKTVQVSEEATLTHARRKKTEYEAKMAQLNFEERAGKLVPVDLVDGLVQELFGQMVDKILNVPSKVAGKVITIKTEREASVFLEDALNEALGSFADEVENGALGRSGERRLAG